MALRHCITRIFASLLCTPMFDGLAWSMALATNAPAEQRRANGSMHASSGRLLCQRLLPEVALERRCRPYFMSCCDQAAKLRRTMTEAEDRKQKRRIAHSKPGSIVVKPARKKKIVAELE